MSFLPETPRAGSRASVASANSTVTTLTHVGLASFIMAPGSEIDCQLRSHLVITIEALDLGGAVRALDRDPPAHIPPHARGPGLLARGIHQKRCAAGRIEALHQDVGLDLRTLERQAIRPHHVPAGGAIGD